MIKILRNSVLSLFTLIVLTCNHITGIQPGKIIDSVTCLNHPNFSYALYLPASYSDSMKWPVIYIFDPRANGKKAVERFVPAAEQYGYILACSNNSKNGITSEELATIINSMMEDFEARFPVNTERIYTSGFSGGSRVASLVALQNSHTAGVIACGAGLPNSVSSFPVNALSYYGIVGDRDMNYVEMTALMKKLKQAGIPSGLKVFAGGHEWPTEELLIEAVEWMQIQAMKKGLIPKDNGMINLLIDKKKNHALSIINQNDFYNGVNELNEIFALFPETKQIAQIKSFADSVAATREYNRQIKMIKETDIEESKLQESYVSAMQSLASLNVIPDSVRRWWLLHINSLKKMENGNNPERQKMAARQLNFLNVAFFESARNLSNSQQFKAAENFYLITTLLQPDNNYLYFLLARNSALGNNAVTSINYLEKAFAEGFKNKPLILSEPAFNGLYKNRKFQDLIEKMDTTANP